MTEEHKAKLRAAMAGRRHTHAMKRKIAEAGRAPHTDEAKLRISVGVRRRLRGTAYIPLPKKIASGLTVSAPAVGRAARDANSRAAELRFALR